MSDFLVLCGEPSAVADVVARAAWLSSHYALLYDTADVRIFVGRTCTPDSFLSDGGGCALVVGEVLAAPDAPTRREWWDAPRIHHFRGNVVVHDRSSQALRVANDVFGSLPLYRSRAGSVHLFGTHLSVLVRLLDARPDHLGVYQFLCKGYTVGHRTLAQGVEQFTPGESVTVRKAGSGWSSAALDSCDLWSADNRRSLDRACLEELTASWLADTARWDRVQLMFSAGWDSRAILAGVLRNRIGDRVVAYSHGDLESRELRLASRICSDHGVSRRVRPIDERTFSAASIERLLDRADTCLFPHWSDAARAARETGHETVSGGIFGAVLGGHYGIPSVHSGYRTATAIARYAFGADETSHGDGRIVADRAMELVRDRTLYLQWSVHDGINREWSKQVRSRNDEDVRARLTQYAAGGVDTVEALVERFQVEHRGRQYMNAQLVIARAEGGITNPFTNPTVARIAAGLPLKHKVHNLATRELVRRVFPALLDYPMAATLVGASRPIVLQELSRVARKVADGTRWKLYGLLPAASGFRPNLGWVNFEFLRDGAFLLELVRSLRMPIWDRERMERRIRNHDRGSMHPLFDMLMKVKTVDHRLSGRRTEVSVEQPEEHRGTAR